MSGSESGVLGHFGPVGPSGQLDLPRRAIRALMHSEATSGRNFLSGDNGDK